MDAFFRTVILHLESSALSCSDGAFALEEKFITRHMLEHKDFKKYLAL
jgi:hypothetical protein